MPVSMVHACECEHVYACVCKCMHVRAYVSMCEHGSYVSMCVPVSVSVIVFAAWWLVLLVTQRTSLEMTLT